MKILAYIVAGLLFTAAGALITGLSVYYTTMTPVEPEVEQVRHAECVLTPSSPDSSISGTILLTQLTENSEVKVTGNITGLAIGLHGFHIHTYGVTGGQCADAEGHYNPDSFTHGAPDSPQRHVGDLGNIESLADGTATVDITDHVISLSGSRSIVGRSVVVHEGEDDLGLGSDQGSITTGNAGARLACCSIYIVP